MNIAIIGYGKMGKTIERIATSRGHNISAIVDRDTDVSLADLSEQSTDVAIEFTNPEVAKSNLSTLADKKIPTVSGTTGWLEAYEDVCNRFIDNESAIIYASNYSVGVNVFFAINKKLASYMADHSDYNISMEEIHHIHKLDAPSGTAITLAEDILQNISTKTKWVNEPSDQEEIIPIISKRHGEVPGTHTVTYKSEIDSITISHEAHSREGFALGAVIAAEWLKGKKGVFSMQDVLGI
jgi:4-hydroxy-tetrahydrodipicolinate reductase